AGREQLTHGGEMQGAGDLSGDLQLASVGAATRPIKEVVAVRLVGRIVRRILADAVEPEAGLAHRRAERVEPPPWCESRRLVLRGREPGAVPSDAGIELQRLRDGDPAW